MARMPEMVAPKARIPAAGQKDRRLWGREWHAPSLGAAISGMRHRRRLRSETGWAEFGYFLCYFKMIAPRALVFRPLVKGNEDSGNEIGSQVQGARGNENVRESALARLCLRHSGHCVNGY